MSWWNQKEGEVPLQADADESAADEGEEEATPTTIQLYDAAGDYHEFEDVEAIQLPTSAQPLLIFDCEDETITTNMPFIVTAPRKKGEVEKS